MKNLTARYSITQFTYWAASSGAAAFTTTYLLDKGVPSGTIGLLLAMAGAVTVSNPTFSSGGYTMLIAFLSALFSGIAYTTVGALKGREEPCVTVFFFSCLHFAVYAFRCNSFLSSHCF